jgi:multimeric flavodoxin WrbA
MKIMLFQGSPRRKGNCPDQWGKTQHLAEHIMNNAPDDVEIDYCDLSISPETMIKPCKGCVSTANGFHCHYPCDCYAPNAIDPRLTDYMHDANIYERLEACDGFLILTPINWYATSGQLKLLFDRLSCINMTITSEQAKEFGINKNAEKSSIVEQSGELHHLLKNHYEGKYGAFLIHGDGGGSDYYEFAAKKRKYMQRLPLAYAEHMCKDYSAGGVDDPRKAIMNLVWQCRYSGIFVPEDLIVGFNATTGISYSEAMEETLANPEDFYKKGLSLLSRLRGHLLNKLV